MNLDPTMVGLIVSILTAIVGGISHFFIVIKKQVEMDTRLRQVESDVVELKKHIPDMHEKMNQIHRMVVEVRAYQNMDKK